MSDTNSNSQPAEPGNIFMFPAWGMTPYLPELIKSLSAHGWSVSYGDRGGLVQALRDRKAIVHLHWTEAFAPDKSLKDAIFAWVILLLTWRAARTSGVVWTIHNYEPHEGYAPMVGRRFHRLLA